MRFFVVAACLLALATGCSSSSSEQCNTFGGACPDGGTMIACCTPTFCHYKTSDGSEFMCMGTNCAGAAQSVTMWCQSH